LVSEAQFPVNRVAIEIHELSGRWAFVSVEDLPADVFANRESIEKLGGLTLFIRDIASLSTNQQLKLAEYLARAASDDTPHVIAASSLSVDDLIHQGRILPYLSRLFTVSTLNTTSNKSAAQITKELVEASLQQLVENARSATVSEHQVGENFIPFNAQYFNPDDQSTVH
jgi:predicted Rossmann fold nucleotide-binding protein DprA/Smf involved in DNA uptake